MRIKSVRLSNYKRFTDLTVTDIPASARLIVLIGPNGSGKSSLFDAFLLKSTSNRASYSLTDEWSGYYLKDERVPNEPSTTRGISDRVHIDLHFDQPAADQWRHIFNIRSAYRNESDFHLTNLSPVQPSSETVRFMRIIDSDQAVSDNYSRLAWKRQADLDGDAPGGTTFEQYRKEFSGPLQAAMRKLFREPALELQDFGGMRHSGVFRFVKGTSRGFHYKNLSGGEKAAFDLLLDMFVKRREYQDAIYCVDEPEAHVATALHGPLLEAMLDLLPRDSQLWIATHAIGFVRKAYEIMKQGDGVVFLDFSKGDFDQRTEMRPSIPNRSFWSTTYRGALDDLADLIAPAKIVICEGSKAKAQEGFDAECYNAIFSDSHPDTLFISRGGAAEVERSDDLIAVLNAVAKGASVWRVIDRDDMTGESRGKKIEEGVNVLRRRELENYLYDVRVLTTFLLMNGKEELTPDFLCKHQELLPDYSPEYSDIKQVTRELFEYIKKTTMIRNLGNRRSEFALQYLVPALKRTPEVLKELEEDVFQ